MSQAADLVTLSWCLAEIRLALNRAELLLEQQLSGDPQDLAPLRSARAHLHQAHGALLVVDIDGVSIVTRECESLIDAIDSQAIGLSAEAVSALTLAFRACVEYLEDLISGVAAQPLYLFPYLKSVLKARAAERIHPADLFFPDLTIQLPPVSRDESAISEQKLAKATGGFEAGLLAFLREPDSPRGVEQMFSAVSVLERSRHASANRNYWRLVLAFFDGLRTGALTNDVYSKRLLARVNLQFRQTIERGGPIADRLFKDTLFSLAYAKQGSPIIKHVQKVYQLDGAVPADFETPRFGRHDVRLIREARDALAKAKIAWDKVMRGTTGEMAATSHALDAFRTAVDQMPGSGMKSLAQALVATRRHLAEKPDAISDKSLEPLTLELATAILFAEQVLEQGGRAGDEYDPQAQEMADRLESGMGGGAAKLGDVPPWLRAFSRAAQERLTMTTFVAETLSNLRSVEKDLDAYFRDPSVKDSVAGTLRQLKQVSGAMMLLGHSDAAAAADIVSERVAGFEQAQELPGKSEFENVASSLGALGFFVEGLLQPERHGGRFTLNRETGEFIAQLGVTGAHRRSSSRSAQAEAKAQAQAQADPAPSAAVGTSLVGDLTAQQSAVTQELPFPALIGLAPEQVSDDQFAEAATINFESASKANARRTETLMASLSQAPQDAAVRSELKQSLEQVRDDAMLHDDGELKRKAAAVLELLADASDQSMVELSDSVAHILAAGQAPPLAPTVLPRDELSVDTELLEIFMAEAQELLEAIANSLVSLRKAPAEQEHLTTIRRGFHTLKGSSRMVGLNTFGEAGWAMEQVMNLWLSDEQPGNDALFDLIATSCGYFTAWVTTLAIDPSSAIDPSAIVAAAGQMRANGLHSLAPYVASDASLSDEVNAAAAAAAFNQAFDAHAGDPEQEETIVALAIDSFTDADFAMPGDTDTDAKRIEVDDELVTPVLSVLDEPPIADSALTGLTSDAAPDMTVNVDDFGVQMDQAIAAMSESVPIVATPAVAAPAVTTAAVTTAAVPGAEVTHSDSVTIGERQVSRPLYTIFLGEADDLIAVLLADCEQWQNNRTRSIDEPVVRAAHSLKGSSALVGLTDVHQLAKQLESIYHQLNAQAQTLEQQQSDVIVHATQAIQSMLHQFAAGREPTPEPHAIEALTILEATLSREREQTTVVTRITGYDRPLLDQAIATAVAEHEHDTIAIAPMVADSVAMISDELDADLLPIFIEEAEDYMPQIGADLRRWAQAPSDLTPAHNLMRALHTIKGSARMAGAMKLGQHVHEMETRVESLLVMQNVPLSMIEALTGDHDQSVALFEAIKDPAKFAPVAPAAGTVVTVATANLAVPAANVATAATSVPAVQLVRVRADVLDRLVNEAGEVSIARSRLDNELSSLRQSLSDLTENVNRLRTQLREIEIQAESQIQTQIAHQKDLDRSFDPLEFDRFTRFQELARMLAESVNDVATVQQNATRNLDTASQDLLRQGQVLRDLQQNLMRVRMVQFGTISDRMYRVVRQAAKDADKRVNLDLRGASSEIDRSVLERMAGPIEHLLRNSVAHGIEARSARAAAGKADSGEIRVEIRQEGNEIVMSFADDGAGLDLAKIKARAIKQGLIGDDAQLTGAEAAELIFSPGFSTAEKVTELSGRGVGMDVVRAETNTLGGRIDIDTVTGKGTTFTVHLPVTLAVAQVVLVTAGNQRFAIPSSSVEQVIQMKPQALAQAYEAKSVPWQSSKLPLIFLGSLVDMADQSPQSQHYSPVVVVRSGNQRLALHVDTISRNQEVVVKNVGPQVARIRGVAGATVLGDGEIVLIINPVVIAQGVGNVFDGGVLHRRVIVPEAPQTPLTVMVVDDSVTVRKVTQRLLARERYEVLLAKDGVDALRQMQDVLPDVMLVDIEMPRMDGFDLTRHIRADERFRHIPIIMITSRTADKHRNYAMSLGVNVYLGKPYVEDELLGHVARFVKRAAGTKTATNDAKALTLS